MSKNGLTSVPQIHLPLLRSLWISCNRIQEVQAVPFLPCLQQLFATDNQMSQCIHLDALPNLRVLDLSFNEFGTLASLDFLGPLRRVGILNLTENPVAQKSCYREKLLSNLPWLQELDNTPLSTKEIKSATRNKTMR